MSAADLAAVVGNRNDGGFGDMGSGWWIILLFLCLFGNGGWGNGYGGGNNGGAGGLYPWMNQAEITSDGFRDQMINNNITGIRDGINSLSSQLCNCCSDMQMTSMQNTFGLQNAINSGVNGIQSQLAQCCCDNRLASADLKYTIATENCADRQALSESTMNIIASQTASTQRILDQLCQDKIDAKNDTIAQLRQELLYARGQASQDVQTAVLRQGQEAEVDALYNRLSNCPVPSMPVYGRTPIFTCNQNPTCGCGCGVG
jgi:hypothetical protein